MLLRIDGEDALDVTTSEHPGRRGGGAQSDGDVPKRTKAQRQLEAAQAEHRVLRPPARQVVASDGQARRVVAILPGIAREHDHSLGIERAE